MALLVLPALLCNAAPARAPYPGKYTLKSGWPAELAKISPMNGTLKRYNLFSFYT